MASHGPSSRCLRTAAAAILALAKISCRADAPPNEIAVIASDYAFRDPDSVPAGPAILSFENTGRVPHEMIFARICDDVSNTAFADSLVRDATASATRRHRDIGRWNATASLRVARCRSPHER